MRLVCILLSGLLMAHASTQNGMPESSKKEDRVSGTTADKTSMALPQRPKTQAASGINDSLPIQNSKAAQVQEQAQGKEKIPNRLNKDTKDEEAEPEEEDQAEDSAQQASAKEDDQSAESSEASTRHMNARPGRLRNERIGKRRMTCNHSREDRLMNVAVTGIVGFCGVIVGACIVGLFMYYQHVRRVKKEYRMSISASHATNPKSAV